MLHLYEPTPDWSTQPCPQCGKSRASAGAPSCSVWHVQEHLRPSMIAPTIPALQSLIARLADALADEGPGWSNDGVHSLRVDVAAALPDALLPDWLRTYRPTRLLPREGN